MDKQQQDPTNALDASAGVPREVSRRSLLSGACKVAVPAIITLGSGSALARSSNLISADNYPAAEQNRYRCLDTSSVYATNKPKVYDLGKDPMAHVTRIRSDKDYYALNSQGQRSNKEVKGTKMCTDGGDFFRKDSGNRYTKVKVRKGVLVSATALSSFASDITYTDV